MKKLIATTAVAMLLAGCATSYITIGEGAKPTDPVAYQNTKVYLFGGLVGRQRIDATKVCQSGNALIHERTNFGNALLSAITGGFLAPRKTTIFCKPELVTTSSKPN